MIKSLAKMLQVPVSKKKELCILAEISLIQTFPGFLIEGLEIKTFWEEDLSLERLDAGFSDLNFFQNALKDSFPFC